MPDLIIAEKRNLVNSTVGVSTLLLMLLLLRSDSFRLGRKLQRPLVPRQHKTRERSERRGRGEPLDSLNRNCPIIAARYLVIYSLFQSSGYNS